MELLLQICGQLVIGTSTVLMTYREITWWQFLNENQAGQDQRTGTKLNDDKVAPANRHRTIFIDKEKIIIPD